MSNFEQNPEVVPSAAYHVDTDNEDIHTSAVMDYDADTDDEGFSASAAAASSAAAVVNKYVNKVDLSSLDVCQEVGASNSSLPPSKREQPSPEEEDRPPERAASIFDYECSAYGCTKALGKDQTMQ